MATCSSPCSSTSHRGLGHRASASADSASSFSAVARSAPNSLVRPRIDRGAQPRSCHDSTRAERARTCHPNCAPCPRPNGHPGDKSQSSRPRGNYFGGTWQR
jgi:hypothetical protein